ncbi:PepSY-associated TM helix [Planktothrix tepida]|uniref:PepSY-associated TM helix n=2 Tax=Planktothrix TaxID=54304 RepID=A0A1J1LD53_9CYAN|nr:MULTISPECIES: PepSY-associated TM helix domain-containing protein [Planktothrix]CAD5913689.1 PepSY-associated TM helix [Planktothrix tepida]CAD5986334.1 PepSY-associated TM helix [Planktothrix pseudagardhii]CUR30517.1 PepSY-associated TM helix [Planktothrix tepida PCC 9214]
MQNLQFRKFHRKIAPIVFIPLFLTAFTGMTYRLGRNLMGLSEEKADFLLIIHQGEFLGEGLVPIYVLLVGLGLIAMIVTGLTMVRLAQEKRKNAPKNSPLNARKIHQILAPIVFLPLFLSASTGILYRLGDSWFHIPDKISELLLRVHQGTYFGSFGRTIYVALIGLGLIAMLITGLNLTGIFRKKRAKISE